MHDDELSSYQAADRLGVSRTFLVNQMKAGVIACRFVSNRYRFKVADVDAYAKTLEHPALNP